jgi:predicted MPP superfamily phosphohydrolase
MAGVTDFRGGDFIPAHKSDPVKALGNKKDSDVKILLAHQPKSIFASAELGFDLQISGHTHGGQYFPWNFLVTLDQPYISGLHRHENTWIYVNRGTGYWGPPLRIGIPSEVTLFTLTKNKSDHDTSI